MLNKKVIEIIKDPDKVSGLTLEEVGILLKDAEQLFEKEPNIIEIPLTEQAIFIGDTHGDFNATKTVVKKYIGNDRILVFLGDYVDGRRNSKANINYLLCLKMAFPSNLFLLQGNHEGYGIFKFHPADFWETVDKELRAEYERVLLKLPLAVSAGSIIALHGALPDVQTISEINKIQVGSEEWKRVTWGDWQETNSGYLGIDIYTGRPQFGRRYFDTLMKRLKKDVLIRSHQRGTRQVIYDDHCLTIFTCRDYMPIRTIAIANLEREIRTVNDLVIELI